MARWTGKRFRRHPGDGGQSSVDMDSDLVVAAKPARDQVLEGIWEDLSRLRTIGARRRLLDWGATSMLAAALVAAVEETVGALVLPPAVLWKRPPFAASGRLLIREEDTFDERLTALPRIRARATPPRP